MEIPRRVLVITCLVSQVAGLYGQCASAAGSWTDGSQFSWVLSQSGSSITGTVTVSPTCPQRTWSVSGTYLGNGNFTVTAYNPTGGDEVCTSWFRYDGVIRQYGCDNGDGTWTNADGWSGWWWWSKPCEIPSAESIESWGWADSQGEPAIHNWVQTLGPGYLSFGGRRVEEQDPGGGWDQCWFVGSPVDRSTSVTGGVWDVGADNRWGPDQVGWRIEAVSAYQNLRPVLGYPLPCTAYLPQRMLIYCGNLSYTPKQEYSFWPLTATVGEDWVESTRGYQHAWRPLTVR